ncbi:MAG: 7-carboxy-7-deazaguanine synthase QueE [Candidatus Heimdallarchaeaceae archaeon]
MLYPVNEIFYSIQGEGFYAGRPAIFIRLSGCNLKCPWCDTDHSKENQMSEIEITDTIQDLLKSCVNNPQRVLFVITGGEPTIYDLEPLTSHLKSFFVNGIALETNGTNLTGGILPWIDWITVSPKFMDCVHGKSTEEYFLALGLDKIIIGDEIKVVFEPGIDIELITVLPVLLSKSFDHFYIQPCSNDFEPAIKFVKENPGWNLSVQIHRLINIS